MPFVTAKDGIKRRRPDEKFKFVELGVRRIRTGELTVFFLSTFRENVQLK